MDTYITTVTFQGIEVQVSITTGLLGLNIVGIIDGYKIF